MALNLSPSESAGSRSLRRLVRQWSMPLSLIDSESYPISDETLLRHLDPN